MPRKVPTPASTIPLFRPMPSLAKRVEPHGRDHRRGQECTSVPSVHRSLGAQCRLRCKRIHGDFDSIFLGFHRQSLNWTCSDKVIVEPHEGAGGIVLTVNNAPTSLGMRLGESSRVAPRVAEIFRENGRCPTSSKSICLRPGSTSPVHGVNPIS